MLAMQWVSPRYHGASSKFHQSIITLLGKQLRITEAESLDQDFVLKNIIQSHPIFNDRW